MKANGSKFLHPTTNVFFSPSPHTVPHLLSSSSFLFSLFISYSLSNFMATMANLSLNLLPNSPILSSCSKPAKPSSNPPTLIPSLPLLLPKLPSLSVASNNAAAIAAALSFPIFLDPQDALAVGGEFGILEGRTLALVHPAFMAGLFFYTLWAGYLGWQWRRVRTIQNEINDLKKQVPSTPVATEADSSAAPPPPPAVSPVEAKIRQLTEERKELVKGGYRDRHFNAGSILLGFGVLESVGGGLNTWFRTGKLFPGPHLFAGAAITVLWAAAAALVPPMQRGSETARNLHIALNAINVLLFVSQIPTGFDIILKVFEFTQWP